MHPPLTHSFTGHKYVLGTPGRVGTVDDEERVRRRANRRAKKATSDVLFGDGAAGGRDEGGWCVFEGDKEA